MTKRDETVLVCERITTPLMLPDNRLGTCRECGTRVQFRPHAPKIARMCVPCALDQIDHVTKIEITQRTLEEVRDYLRKRRQ
jgi:hypothetical protein